MLNLMKDCEVQSGKVVLQILICFRGKVSHKLSLFNEIDERPDSF